MSWAARTAYRWDRNGSTATLTRSPVERASKLTTPPLVGGPDGPDQGDPGGAHQRPVGVESRGAVVVSGDGDDLGAGVAQREQGLHDQLLGVGGRRRRVVQVAGDEHRVELVFARRCRRSAPITARCSSSRLRPLRVLPTCQSEVCRNFTCRSSLRWRNLGGHGSEGRCVVGGLRQPAERGGRRPVRGRRRRGAALGLPGRPGRERELDGQRHRDLRLADEHGARLGQGGPGALAGRQEPVLGAAGLGRRRAGRRP